MQLAILCVVRQWRENFSQTINVQLETTTVNIFDIIFILVLCSRIIGHLIMKLIKSRPKWVGEAVSSIHDSRRKKTFYRQVCMLIIISVINHLYFGVYYFYTNFYYVAKLSVFHIFFCEINVEPT